MGHRVAPYAGAWIEIRNPESSRNCRESLPTRERGLKFLIEYFRILQHVVPYAGAWIEIKDSDSTNTSLSVAPYAGAWIEIVLFPDVRDMGRWSLPTRERGLKFKIHITNL